MKTTGNMLRAATAPLTLAVRAFGPCARTQATITGEVIDTACWQGAGVCGAAPQRRSA